MAELFVCVFFVFFFFFEGISHTDEVVTSVIKPFVQVHSLHSPIFLLLFPFF